MTLYIGSASDVFDYMERVYDRQNRGVCLTCGGRGDVFSAARERYMPCHCKVTRRTSRKRGF